MRARLLNYIAFIDQEINKELTEEQRKALFENYMNNLKFFQHERIIHLLVTLTFAIISVLGFAMNFFMDSLLLIIFDMGMCIMTFFYVRHYFLLERGVQKLYTYYDRFSNTPIFTKKIIEP